MTDAEAAAVAATLPWVHGNVGFDFRPTDETDTVEVIAGWECMGYIRIDERSGKEVFEQLHRDKTTGRMLWRPIPRVK